jgi:hypothetical protein
MAASAKHPRTLATLLWLCALPALPPRPALAQEESAPAPGTPDGNQPGGGAASPLRPEAERSNTVLFLLPAANDNQVQLRDALLAQFALIDATLVFEPETAGDASLSARLAEAQSQAASHDAIAVFWLDTQASGRWFLHMMDAKDERVIVRPVDATGERRPAAIEAVAVMTRSSARALIEDVPEPIAPAAPPPTAPQPAAPAPRRDWLRLWLGYAGSDFASEVDWQHGVELGAAWLGFAPFYGGLSFFWVPPIQVNAERASFSLQRTPFAAQLGYSLSAQQLSMNAELGFVLDWLHRPASTKGMVAGENLEAHAASDGLIAALAPRLRAELRVLPVLGLYAGGGLDILLNTFPYIANRQGASCDQPGVCETLLQPKRYRPVAELGLSFYP